MKEKIRTSIIIDKDLYMVIKSIGIPLSRIVNQCLAAIVSPEAKAMYELLAELRREMVESRLKHELAELGYENITIKMCPTCKKVRVFEIDGDVMICTKCGTELKAK